MNIKRLLALLLAFGLVASACGSSDSDGEAGGETPATTETEEDAPTTEPEATEIDEPADEILTDFGVTDDVIKIGLNPDLSGPFGSLVSEIVQGQTIYWDTVNANGGIAGRQIEMTILDSGYATDKGIENYGVLAQESDEGVLIISENTGSPITAAIAEDAIDDDMLVIPLSWASLWPDPEIGANILEKGATYCVEAMNGVSFLNDLVTEAGETPKLAIISRPGEYGEDGHVGAEIAAEELGIEIVYNAKGEVAGDDRTAIVSQLVASGANMVWVTLTPGETADIFGNAVAGGMTAQWSGNLPSFNYLFHLGGDLAPAFDEYYWQSGFNLPWNVGDSEGMSEMVAAFNELAPDLPLADGYVTGWMEGMIVQTILEQAAANGDMTRAGMVAASKEVVVDFKGISPNQGWAGEYNDSVVRETYIFDVSLDAFDIQPVSAGTGGTGLPVHQGPFVSDVAANYVFDGPCI